MPGRKFFLAVLLGLLPTAMIYAVAGAYSLSLKNGMYVFVAVTILAGVVWLIGRRTTGNPTVTQAE